MNDAMWIADLAAYGLIRAELRARRRVPRVADADADAQAARARSDQPRPARIQKTLTEANIRLDSVISDIMGVNGRRMIEAIIEGVRPIPANWRRWAIGG